MTDVTSASAESVCLNWMRKGSLIGGILAALVWAAANVIVPLRYPGYDWVTQTVSELSAIDTPTRQLWVAFMVPYTLLLIGFGWGVWLSAGTSRMLQISAICTVAHAMIGFFWPPMHMRGIEATVTDTLHIVWTAITVPLMIAQVAFAAAALDRWFRIYSAATIASMIGFGVLTSLEAPNIAINGPTPMIGVWERISIAAYMLWLPVFAIKMLRNPN